MGATKLSFKIRMEITSVSTIILVKSGMKPGSQIAIKAARIQLRTAKTNTIPIGVMTRTEVNKTRFRLATPEKRIGTIERDQKLK